VPRFALVVAVAAFALLRPGPAAEARPAAPVALAAPSGLRLDLVTAFVDQINLLRRTLGLPTLQVSSQLSSVATRWAQQMAAEDRLYHNPNLGSQVSGWIRLGENVGVGYDVLGLMDAFIGSPGHYANLVDPHYTLLGVGVANGPNGTIYTTHDFMTPEEAEPAPPPDPQPDPDPAPDPSPAPTPRPRAPRPAPAPSPEPAPAPVESPVAPETPGPHPTEQRVAAVLAPLRALEAAAPSPTR
jgi:uncharacterized protein YkwD